jgi:protein-S-isoprenylcysteine O-methyltransferase Ste14
MKINLLIIISIVWVLSEIILSVVKRAKNSHHIYDKSSLRILWATITLSITAGVILKDTKFLISHQNYVFISYLGIFFIGCGLIIRWIAILKLKKSFTVNVSVSVGQVIIQTGIYKYIRHPSYSGGLLAFLGLGIAFDNWLSLAIIFIPISGAFLYRIHVEEKALITTLSKQYTDYMKRTWRLIPKIY